MSGKTLDEIANQMEDEFRKLQSKNNRETKIELQIVSQSFACDRFLESLSSRSMVFFVIFMIQAPDGLCKGEIKHLSKLRPKMFTYDFVE